MTSLTIGSLSLKGSVILAPLAGITYLPFRRMVKRCGTAMVCSEMVSAKGLMYASEKTRRLLETSADERPLSVQIFGEDPESMAFAARYITSTGGADVVDINFGCSVKKVIKTGAGVALMKTPGVAGRIMAAVRRATHLSLTIKIRSGWDVSGDQAVEIARLAQDCGVDALTVHPRTATQGFRGQANWDIIGRVKSAVRIPVIGNGDIAGPEDALEMVTQTRCDGVMVGRAAMGDPFLPARIESALAGRHAVVPDAARRFQAMRDLLIDGVDYFGEVTACKMMRSRLVWFVKGWPGSSGFRKALTGITTLEQALDLIDAYEQRLSCHNTV